MNAVPKLTRPEPDLDLEEILRSARHSTAGTTSFAVVMALCDEIVRLRIKENYWNVLGDPESGTKALLRVDLLLAHVSIHELLGCDGTAPDCPLHGPDRPAELKTPTPTLASITFCCSICGHQWETSSPVSECPSCRPVETE